MPESSLIIAIVFGATLIQSVAGFGSSMIAMPLLSWLVGVQVAAPLVALMSMSLEIPLLVRYRASFNRRAMRRFTLSAVFGIPVGILALRIVPETIILTLLGLLLVGYALYALVAPKLPPLSHPSWVYGFGFIAGCLGGAYNTAGPPIIVYGNLNGWPRDEFKSNLQGFFVSVGALVIGAHAASGNLTPEVWQRYALTLPAIALGLLLGLSLDRWLRPELFKKLVLVLLLGLGIGLLQ